MNKKKVFGGIAGAIGFGVWVLLKIFGGSAEVELTNAMGSGWDDSKSDMLADLSQAVNLEFEGVALEDATKTKIAECRADKSIAFLNETDCSYLYDPNVKSEAEHLKDQEACMAKVGFEAKAVEFNMECCKANVPDDWAIVKGMFKSEFSDSLAEEGVAQADADKYGECVGDKLAALMTARKNPLINKEAKGIEEFLFGLDKYITDFSADEDFKGIIEECRPKEK